MGGILTAETTISLQSRDILLLRGLFECRVMTLDHAAALYFQGKKDAAKKRLQKIKAAGYINARPRRAFDPAILFLTRKGLTLLQQEGVLNDYPPFDLPALERRARVSELTIRHELEVMDVKAAFHSRLQRLPDFAIAEFSTWPMLNEFTAYRHDGTEVLVKPDGFIRIHETEFDGGRFERAFFLEVDRSTETQETLIARAGCYHHYYKSGGFALRNRASREDYRQFPFRVLLVFKTAERRNNTAERLLEANPSLLKQVCLSTLEEVIHDPFGKIWVNPGEYRVATDGTPFDVQRGRALTGVSLSRGTSNYKRQTAREHFIEQHLRKFSILVENPRHSPAAETTR